MQRDPGLGVHRRGVPRAPTCRRCTPRTPKIGSSVDIFVGLPEDVASAGDVFCVGYGPYWTRFPTRTRDGQVAFDLGSLADVVPVIVAAFAGEGDAPRLLGKIKVPAAALETNQRYFKVVDVSSLDPGTGEVVRGGKLDLALTYRREARSSDGIWALARQYLKPTRSDKWYYNPIPENEQEKVAKAQGAGGEPARGEQPAGEEIDREGDARLQQARVQLADDPDEHRAAPVRRRGGPRGGGGRRRRLPLAQPLRHRVRGACCSS